MKLILFLNLFMLFSSIIGLANEPDINTITSDESKEGWKLLWDGKTSTGWRSARNNVFPDNGWKIANGFLTVLKSDSSEGGKGGDIITEDKYSSFDLKVDFKITKGANSGIKYFVDTTINSGPGSSIGLEFQILDDANHRDAKKGKDGNRSIGSLYDLIAATSNKKVNPVGQWNSARIISKGAHVEHWLNGVKVVEFKRFTPEFRAKVADSKYAKWKDFGELNEGHILLQDHGDEVSFKNIKIRVLKD